VTRSGVGAAALVCCGLLAGCSRSGLLLPDPIHACFVLDPEALSEREIAADVSVDRSDFVFLVDMSSSMRDEIARIREQLVDVLVPGIYSRVKDARLGVAVFSDFGERKLGSPSHPYLLLEPMTKDIDRVLNATRGIELESGADIPESQLEALYQVATGDGLGTYVEKGPDCPDGGRGGVCFRPGSFANVLLFTDAPMRGVVGIQTDGTPSAWETLYLDGNPPPYVPYERTYDETIEALQAENIRVLGLWSGEADGIDDMRRVVKESGGLNAAGDPIVLDIGEEGEGLGEGVVQALESVRNASRLSIQLNLFDADPNDGVDPTDLVTEARPARIEPADGGVVVGDRFEEVRAGTRVVFEVTFDTSPLAPAAYERRFPLAMQVATSDGAILMEKTVDVFVAPEGVCGETEGL
jgi:hypothetical protein